MKGLKKILSLPAALALVLGFSTCALASAGETICLNKSINISLDEMVPEVLPLTEELPNTILIDIEEEGLLERPLPLDLPAAALVHSDGADLYSRADEDSRVLETLDTGAECFIIEPFIDGLWHRVIYGDKKGYINAGLLDTSACEDIEYVFHAEQSMRTMTGYSGEELEKCLYAGLEGLGECFAEAERTYGVNALFLIAICQEESASGTSGLAVSRNNLAGLGGAGNWRYFDSYADCVDYLADLLSNYYLNPESSFYHGNSINGVSVTYCGGSAHWIKNINHYINQNIEAITAE